MLDNKMQIAITKYYENRQVVNNTNTDFEKMYNTYYLKVFSFIFAQSRNKELAEEITQNTFFKAFTTDKLYRGESSEFTWLCTIAKNMLYEHMRKTKQQGAVEIELSDTANIELSLLSEETTLEIHKVLHTLEEPYKEVFSLRVFGELSFQKIGLVFGKTENWARVTYHRARLKISERMENHE